MRKDTRVVGVPLMEHLIARSMNNTSRHRTLPVGGNAEYYLRDGKPVLRPKSSSFKKGLPKQTQALAACAAEAKGKDFASKQELYKFMDECMARRGFGTAGVTGKEETE